MALVRERVDHDGAADGGKAHIEVPHFRTIGPDPPRVKSMSAQLFMKAAIGRVVRPSAPLRHSRGRNGGRKAAARNDASALRRQARRRFASSSIARPSRPRAYGFVRGLFSSALMSRAALSLSLCTKRANSGCVMLIGSPPCSVIQSRRSGLASTRPMSFESLATTSAGVPAGTQIPYQIGKSNPATPASAIVGTSGSKVERRAVVTPSGRSLPSRIRGNTIAIGAIKYVVRPSMVPATISAIASVGRGGTSTALIPALRLNFTTPKCVPVPRPVEPNLSLPGFAFAAAMSWLTVVKPADLPAMST